MKMRGLAWLCAFIVFEVPYILHFEPSLDALSLRSDVKFNKDFPAVLQVRATGYDGYLMHSSAAPFLEAVSLSPAPIRPAASHLDILEFRKLRYFGILYAA